MHLSICFIIVILAGCVGLRPLEMPQVPDGVPSSHELAQVPFYPQKAYQCGPAALAMALNWSGLPIRPEDLVDEVYTPSLKGSLQVAMLGATRRHGRLGYEIADLDALFPEIAAGHPVIILQNLGLSWYPLWHYAVVIGYDANRKNVILRSGVTFRKLMSFGVFEKTWARANYWGLMVLQPGELPALAEEEAYLEAVLGLEITHQYQAAIAAYQSALMRWPGSFPALMGLGNTHYALGDLKGSEHVFKEAVRLHPHAGPAYNNLAQVLLEQGHTQEALEAVRKAISLGGPMASVYQDTLHEIQNQISK